MIDALTSRATKRKTAAYALTVVGLLAAPIAPRSTTPDYATPRE